MAQIAAEVRRGNVKSPRTVKVKDFLLEPSDEDTTPPRAEQSKGAWAKALQLKLPKEKGAQ